MKSTLFVVLAAEATTGALHAYAQEDESSADC
jgi:hypothetical protein